MAFCLIYSGIQAQDSSMSKGKCMYNCTKFRYFGYMGLGYQYTQFNSMNIQTQDLNGHSISLNGGGFAFSGNRYLICHRMLFGQELSGSGAMPTNNSTSSSMVSQASAFFNFGYLVVDKNDMMLYPYVGIGGVFNELMIKNKSNTDWVNAEYAIKAGQKGNFSSAGGGINVGIGFKKILTGSSGCNSSHSMQIGFDIGARFMPYKSDWYYNGSDQAIGTFGSANNMSYYARVTIGAGSVKSKAK